MNVRSRQCSDFDVDLLMLQSTVLYALRTTYGIHTQ